MEEPSVFDYVKSKILFWKNIRVDIPDEEDLREEAHNFSSTQSERQQVSLYEYQDMVGTDGSAKKESGRNFPWRILVAVGFSLIAQSLLEPPQPSVKIAIGGYLLSAIFWIWAILKGNLNLESVKDAPFIKEKSRIFSVKIKKNPFLLSLFFILSAFITFGNNRFTLMNLLFWFAAIFFMILALWESDREADNLFNKIIKEVKNGEWSLHINVWTILLIIVSIICIFYRFHLLDQVPGEMFSDHAEKLLDVGDVLDGKTSIFFERNTGREAIQMYLTAAVALLFNTGLSFISLKIGTVTAGLLTLPYIYMLGKEIGNRWIGLLALFFTGIAYWPNVISRIGLRFPLYPLFVAPTLFYLIRGLRNSSRNDFIFAGIFLGLGLHGYSPFRVMPIVVVFCVAVYLLHEKSRIRSERTVLAVCILAFVALVIFLPLLRYMLENPGMFNYRAMTRMGQAERAFDRPIWLIFITNLWNASIMFFWKNGNIWVHSVTDRPALDVVSAAFFMLGVLFILFRYIRNRDWVDLFLLLSIPLLMAPSIMSLAFPDENPSLNRSGGAIIPVFIIMAMAFEAIFSSFYRNVKSKAGSVMVSLVGLLLITFSMTQNYDLVFNQFNRQFMYGALNTSEIGETIRGFVDSIGDKDTAYVVPYPYWVDTRLVGINAGFPEKDYALPKELISDTTFEKRPKLFIFKPEDIETLNLLTELYPAGVLSLEESKYPGKEYYKYLVANSPSSYSR